MIESHHTSTEEANEQDSGTRCSESIQLPAGRKGLTADQRNERRILIVEDEALIAEELQMRLENLSYGVVSIEDTGPRAIRSAAINEPSLVLMDIQLKGSMDGIEAARCIERELGIPVVFLTAHSDPLTFKRAKDSNPFGYVMKPFEERELVIAIEMALHRHMLEQRLKNSELRYAATLASIGDGVVATDNSGCITFMNYVAEGLTCWRGKEVMGRPFQQVISFIDEATRLPVENPILRVFEAKQLLRSESSEVLVPRTGEAIPIDWNAAPVMDAEGRITGAVMAFRDMRQRRLAEDALRQAEAQLRQAQKMEAVGRLAGGIAHDFNNLVTIIFLNSELLLLNEHLEPGDADCVREIKQAGDKAASLTGQLLAFSRQQVVKPVVFDVNLLIANLKKMLERLIGEDIELVSNLFPERCCILADPGQIEQLVLNLAVNARDAMPNGGSLTLATRRGPNLVSERQLANRVDVAPGNYVEISVTDTGTGIDEALQGRIFEPFFTTKEAGRGTGLGLAIVYGAVKQAGGFVELESAPGCGTTFRVFLPESGPRDQSEGGTAGETSTVRGTETILLVEDAEGLRAVTAASLKRCGYTVYTAANGRDALSLCEHFANFDLLVTDVVMPGLGGRQLAECLQRKIPRLQVLYMSGYTDDAVLRHGVSQGEVAFLHKPFGSESLAHKVRQLLDEAKNRLPRSETAGLGSWGV